jgi:hypothetical protein
MTTVATALRPKLPASVFSVRTGTDRSPDGTASMTCISQNDDRATIEESSIDGRCGTSDASENERLSGAIRQEEVVSLGREADNMYRVQPRQLQMLNEPHYI